MPLNHMLKKYYAQSSDQDDLISIGTIGLIKGISSFDPSKGARLATYAARCIENAILSPMRLNTETTCLSLQTGLAGGYLLSFPRAII